LSPFTVQRKFKEELGVSPLQYQRALRAASLRGALKEGESVTNAIYKAGFGSSSRAYEGAQLGMTPARFAQGGRGEQIGYTTARSPFGWLVLGSTARGLCWLALAATSAEAEASLRAEFPLATLHRDASLAALVDAALRSVGGPAGMNGEGAAPQVPLDLRGTSAAPDSARRDAQLQPVGERNGRAERDPRRGPRLRHQSRGAGGALPSRRGSERRSDGLPLGRGEKAAAARGGGSIKINGPRRGGGR
jgi:AraC family transcriptional regulator of adaptative response/methylated-DNA-[protein]-cysteine methyltransferase